MQAYGVVNVHDPALDLPVPHDDCLHGLSEGCLNRACKSEEILQRLLSVWDLVVLLCMKAVAVGYVTI